MCPNPNKVGGQPLTPLGFAWPQWRLGNVLALAKGIALLALLCRASLRCHEGHVSSVSRGQQRSYGQGS